MMPLPFIRGGRWLSLRGRLITTSMVPGRKRSNKNRVRPVSLDSDWISFPLSSAATRCDTASHRIGSSSPFALHRCIASHRIDIDIESMPIPFHSLPSSSSASSSPPPPPPFLPAHHKPKFWLSAPVLVPLKKPSSCFPSPQLDFPPWHRAWQLSSCHYRNGHHDDDQIDQLTALGSRKESVSSMTSEKWR